MYSAISNPERSRLSPKKSQEKLWKESQASLNYSSPQVSFSREKRFKLHSIYWPEKNHNPINRLSKQRSECEQIANKICKQIDEEEKNQIRIKKTKTDRSMMDKFKTTSFIYQKPTTLREERKKFVLSNKNLEVMKRIGTGSPTKQSLLRDRHGNRCNLLQESEDNLPGIVSDEMKIMGASNGFKTSSYRQNLKLPHNYYPGPGAYEIKRYLEEKAQQKKLGYASQNHRQMTAR